MFHTLFSSLTTEMRNPLRESRIQFLGECPLVKENPGSLKMARSSFGTFGLSSFGLRPENL